MDDQDRIMTLRRNGFDNRVIAAVLGVEPGDVKDALEGVDPLPAGGGGSSPSASVIYSADLTDAANIASVPVDGNADVAYEIALAGLFKSQGVATRLALLRLD